MQMAGSELSVGSTFSSFEELEAKIKAYQSEKFVQLVKRDTRTLEMAKKRVPKRVEGSNTTLVYYSIHYTCAFGGKSYKNEGTGQRRNQRWVISLLSYRKTDDLGVYTLSNGVESLKTRFYGNEGCGRETHIARGIAQYCI